MARSPDDRRYSKEHEWVRIDGAEAVVGITDFAQEQLGDVVYVDLPGIGATVRQFEKMGEIESVKAVSELFAPASGEVIEANTQLSEHPELVNSDPHGAGWLVRLRLADETELEALMPAAEYDAFAASVAKDEAIGP